MKAIFANPVAPVLIGLVIVLGVGFWVMSADKPAAGDTAKQGDKGSSGGTPPGTTPPSTTPPATTPKTETPPTTATPPKTEEKPAETNDQATLAARSKIDRSAGAAKSMLVTVYYADGLKNGLSLQPVEIKVASSVSRIKVTAEQIINAPQDLKLHSNVPAGTKVLGVNLKDGVAIVDLSAEAGNVQGSGAANDMIASFVYSMTAIPDVKAVQLRIEGKPATLHGIDWSKPLSRAELEGRNLFKVEPVLKYSGS